LPLARFGDLRLLNQQSGDPRGPGRYLHSEQLRREIHEGLNVIEQWNGANDFVFFARRGELASNRHEDQ
jgi:hypothetical protein